MPKTSPTAKRWQYVAVGPCVLYRCELTPEDAVKCLHAYAISLRRVRVWKIPVKVYGTFHDDGRWHPESGQAVLVKTPKLKYLARSTVANIPIGPRKVPEDVEFGYLASGRGLAFFCGESREHAMDRWNNFTRSETDPVLWKIPAGVPCAVKSDAVLVPDVGVATIVKPKKRTPARAT